MALAYDTLAASGVSGAITGTLAKTNTNDTLAATGTAGSTSLINDSVRKKHNNQQPKKFVNLFDIQERAVAELKRSIDADKSTEIVAELQDPPHDEINQIDDDDEVMFLVQSLINQIDEEHLQVIKFLGNSRSQGSSIQREFLSRFTNA